LAGASSRRLGRRRKRRDFVEALRTDQGDHGGIAGSVIAGTARRHRNPIGLVGKVGSASRIERLCSRSGEWSSLSAKEICNWRTETGTNGRNQSKSNHFNPKKFFNSSRCDNGSKIREFFNFIRIKNISFIQKKAEISGFD
jgi:hypothetical protein